MGQEFISDYAEYLIEQSRSDIAVLHEFRILYSMEKADVHVFFEGDEDVMFYLPEIRRRCDCREINFYVCGGKKNVLEVRKMILAGGYSSEKCSFFVDRDYDDYLGCQAPTADDIYVTADYSFENELATSSAAEVLLMDLGQMPRADPQFRIAIGTFSQAQQNFYRHLKPFAAWVLMMREQQRKPNVANVRMRNIFHVSADGTVRKSRSAFATFRKDCGLAGERMLFSEIRRWIRALGGGDEKKWVRGKWDLWFFSEFFIAHLSQAKGPSKGRGKRRWVVPEALRQNGRLIEALGARLARTAHLSEFLERRFRAST